MENNKECETVQRKILKDGTIKEYRYTKKYKTKGYTHKNGEVKGRLTNEQKAEITKKLQEGVTIKRLCDDYNSSYVTIKKLDTKRLERDSNP